MGNVKLCAFQVEVVEPVGLVVAGAPVAGGLSAVVGVGPAAG